MRRMAEPLASQIASLKAAYGTLADVLVEESGELLPQSLAGETRLGVTF